MYIKGLMVLWNGSFIIQYHIFILFSTFFLGVCLRQAQQRQVSASSGLENLEPLILYIEHHHTNTT